MDDRRSERRAVSRGRLPSPATWRLWAGNALIYGVIAFGVYWLGGRLIGMLFLHER